LRHPCRTHFLQQVEALPQDRFHTLTRAFGRDLLKRFSFVTIQNCFLADVFLPSPDNAVCVLRIDLHQPGFTAAALTADQRRARASEEIGHDIAGLAAVDQSTLDECVFRSDNLAAYFEACGLHRVLKLALPRRRVAHVHRGAGFRDSEIAREYRLQELLELLGGHLVALNLEPILRIALVIDVVRRVRED
jgi:hypothetical protein